MTKNLKITSKNNLYQLIQTLKTNRTKRYREKLCVVESIKAIKLALENSFELSYLCFDRDRKLSNWGREFLKDSNPEFLVEVDATLYADLCDKEEASEFIAVFKIKDLTLEELNLKPEFKIIALDNVSNPGNLGSIIRSADAFNYDLLLTLGHATDLWDPKCIRASLGCCFSLPCLALENWNSLKSFIELQAHNVQIIGTSASAKTKLENFMAQAPFILCFGNETRGIGKSTAELCTDLIGIEMQGAASSLNLACAASIVMYNLKQ